MKKRLINWFKPYGLDIFAAGERVPFASHATWTRRAAMEWAAMYPAWCDVVVWRAASFGRLPRVEGQRLSMTV
jgi:hypothetical protein